MVVRPSSRARRAFPFRLASQPGSAVALLGGLGLLAVASQPGLGAPKPVSGTARRTPGVAPASGGPKVYSKPVAFSNRPNWASLPEPNGETMSVSEVRAGMKGYGLTVFQGTKIERFGVEVIGVLPKMNTGQPLVLVRFSGGPISERGAFLIRGMSGSPIYINGKLLGAFAYANPFPKEPIGMVTPIEDMLEGLDPKLPPLPAGEPALDPQPTLPAGTNAQAAQTVRPMAIPVMVSGLSPRNVERAAEFLRPFNMQVAQGPGSMEQPLRTELVPGAALGVALMTGDIDFTAIGTVTYRKGNDLLAFGHPWFQLGAAEFPITTAYIHDVFPAFESSFKIGSTGEVVGTLTQDRAFGISGKLGQKPPMIPLTVKVDDKSTGRSRTYHCEAAKHPMMISQLLPMAMNQAVFNLRPVPGDATARVKLTVETEGAGTLRRENVFFDAQTIDTTVVRELQELLLLLSGNSFRRVPVKRMDAEITLETRRPTATVERIFLGQETFKPGEVVPVGVVVRPYRKEPVVLKTSVRIPESATDGRAVLVVTGGNTRINLASMLAGVGSGGNSLTPAGPPPDASLAQVLKRWSTRERNDQLAARLVFPTTAVNINGERVSRLPSTVVDIMRSTKSTGFRMERDIATQLSEAGYVLDGMQALTLAIEKDSHLEKPKGALGGTGLGNPGITLSPLNPGFPASIGDGEDEDLASAVQAGKLRRVTLPFTLNDQPRLLRYYITPEEGEDEPESGGKREAPKGRVVFRPQRPAGEGAAGEAKEKETAPKTEPADTSLIGRTAQLWTQSAMSDFAGGTFNYASVTTLGEVRLAPALKLLHETSEPYVWSVAGVAGAAYAGTGNGGQVLKVAADGTTTPFFRTGELQVHALARDAAGNLYAGTSPNGKLFRIAPDGKGTELLSLNGTEAAADAGSRFVLSLAVAADGTVYAGCGPDGKLYRVAPGAAKAELLCTLPEPCVTSLLAGPDGVLYAGTGEGGCVYRVQGGKASVLYDTDQSVVTGLALDKEGAVFAACAPSGVIYRIEANGTPKVHYSRTKTPLYGLLSDPGGNLYTCTTGSVLKISPDGHAEVLSDTRKPQFTCLAWDDQGRMVVGGANVGGVYRLSPAREGSFESTVRDAKLPARWGRVRYTGDLPAGGSLQVETRSGNTPEPDGEWSAWQETAARETGQYVASPSARYLQYRVRFTGLTGAPSLRDLTISYLPQNQAPRLTLASPGSGEILNGTYTLRWSAEDPDKDTLTYQVAYSGDGGKSWQPVTATASATGAGASRPTPPPAARPTRASAEEALRKYREELEKDKSLTPELREQNYQRAKTVIEGYMKENGPGGESPAPAGASASGGAGAGMTRLASFAWDTKSVPDGLYMIRVTATDAAANPEEGLSDTRTSEPFIVANTPPQLFLFEKGITVVDGVATVTGFAAGRVSLKGAQFRVGTGEWVAIRADDELWDSANEHFRFRLPVTGKESVEVKVVDGAGNVAVAKVVVK